MFSRMAWVLIFAALVSNVPASAQVTTTGPSFNPATPYSVDGLALGGRVNSDSSVYDEYRCSPSEQFDGFIWCQRRRTDQEARGQFVSSWSILHSQDGKVVYVNRSLMPAFFDRNEAQDEINRLSNKHGTSPRIISVPTGPGMPSGFIAVWGNVTLTPLDATNVNELAAGRNIRAGLMIDHIGNFQQSAKIGMPIYRLGGGAGYVWAGSWDERGRGSLRFLTIDSSAFAPQAAEVPRAAADDAAKQKDAEADAQRRIAEAKQAAQRAEAAAREAEENAKRRIAEADQRTRTAEAASKADTAPANTPQQSAPARPVAHIPSCEAAASGYAEIESRNWDSAELSALKGKFDQCYAFLSDQRARDQLRPQVAEVQRRIAEQKTVEADQKKVAQETRRAEQQAAAAKKQAEEQAAEEKKRADQEVQRATAQEELDSFRAKLDSGHLSDEDGVRLLEFLERYGRYDAQKQYNIVMQEVIRYSNIIYNEVSALKLKQAAGPLSEADEARLKAIGVIAKRQKNRSTHGGTFAYADDYNKWANIDATSEKALKDNTEAKSRSTELAAVGISDGSINGLQAKFETLLSKFNSAETLSNEEAKQLDTIRGIARRLQWQEKQLAELLGPADDLAWRYIAGGGTAISLSGSDKDRLGSYLTTLVAGYAVADYCGGHGEAFSKDDLANWKNEIKKYTGPGTKQITDDAWESGQRALQQHGFGQLTARQLNRQCEEFRTDMASTFPHVFQGSKGQLPTNSKSNPF